MDCLHPWRNEVKLVSSFTTGPLRHNISRQKAYDVPNTKYKETPSDRHGGKIGKTGFA